MRLEDLLHAGREMRSPGYSGAVAVGNDIGNLDNTVRLRACRLAFQVRVGGFDNETIAPLMKILRHFGLNHCAHQSPKGPTVSAVRPVHLLATHGNECGE